MHAKMTKGPARPIGLAVLVVIALLLSDTAYAADEATVLRARAAQLASRDECQEAIGLLDRASRLDPAGGTETALMKGRCLVQLRRYAEARPLLEQAVALDPESGEAALALGMARYHLGDRAGAYPELERAEKMMPERPEPPLYLGLILLDRAQTTDAVARLDRASSLNADGFEPAAGYFAALAHAGAGDAERSDEALRRVMRLAPGSVWGDRAWEALESADERRARPELTRWITLQAGLDYDSNVSLRSDAISQPANISNDEDGRGWWGLDAGAELFRRSGWSGGVGARYTGYEYFRAEDFDQHFVTGRVWLDRLLTKTLMARVSPEGGFGFFDGSEYIRFAGVRPELRKDWGRSGIGTFYGRYAYNDFRVERRDPVAANRNFQDRDGHDISGGYDHQIPLGATTALRGGIFGRHYIAEGEEYDHSGGGGWLGLHQQLPLDFELDLTGSLAYDVYQSKSSFRLPGEAGHEREDLIGTASAILSRPITDWLTLSARWKYLNNDSNTRVFDYERHVVGAYVTIQAL